MHKKIDTLLSIIVTVGIVLLDKLPVARAPMMLVVNSSDLLWEVLAIRGVTSASLLSHDGEVTF